MKQLFETSSKKNVDSLWACGTEIVAFFIVVSTLAMYYNFLLSFAALTALPHVHSATSATPQALNKTNTNLVPNGKGPVLYYNGSGPVPSYDVVSPTPSPITPISR